MQPHKRLEITGRIKADHGVGQINKATVKSRNKLRMLGVTDRDLQDVLSPRSQFNQLLAGDGGPGIGSLQYTTDRNFKTLGAYDKLTIPRPSKHLANISTLKKGRTNLPITRFK